MRGTVIEVAGRRLWVHPRCEFLIRVRVSLIAHDLIVLQLRHVKGMSHRDWLL